MDTCILAGDIGGTKTVLALYDTRGSSEISEIQETVLAEQTYRNSEFSGLPEIITAFLAEQEEYPTHACFGIAGPVRENKVQMTNLDWVVDGPAVAAQFGLDNVLLVNDLVATTAGVLALHQEKLITVNTGQADTTGSVGVLALGTGLGQSFAISGNNQFQPFPTEGGHVSFAPRNQEQIELLQFLLRDSEKRFSPVHISVEQVCSGMALPTLYAFQRSRCLEQEPAWMEKKRKATAPEALTPLIVEAANAAVAGGPACEPALRAVQLLLDILADEAANFALKVLATSGIYLGGGLLPRLLPHLDRKRFMELFCRGVYQEMLAAIPIHIITEPKTALLGARNLAMQTEKRLIISPDLQRAVFHS
ncbi:glucokinase [Candidatus Electrothrix sp.]|uniref:glucokinase n=1 Tax=Candidatus Electrothrix sp. TaxID=2170559 RepID=UPI004057A337